MMTLDAFTRRRLAETSSADELTAEKAGEHWGEGKDDCVFDVLAMGDLEMALAGLLSSSLETKGGIRIRFIGIKQCSVESADIFACESSDRSFC
jgi:hypothetical protein